jgi:MFS family permease
MSRTADELTGPAHPGEHGGTGPGASAPARHPRGLAGLQPFRHRAFTVLWTAGLISTIGSWMQTVAVGALVISDTGKATWAVLVAAGGFLPIGLLSPVGGALADRLPRRPVLVLGNLAAAGSALLLAVLVAAGRSSPAALVALVTVQGSASALIGPFQQAILPDLVPPTEFLAAVSLNSAEFNLGRIAGPALAGATVAAFGYPVAFVANAASFLAVVLALGFVRLARPTGQPAGLLSSLRSGYAAARAEPACRTAIGTIALVAFLASPFIALVPVMAHRLAQSDHLPHGGAREVAQCTALLTTAQGVGAVLGALCLAPLAARLGRGRVLAASLVLLPVVLVGYSAARTPWQGAATLFLVGLVYIGVLSGLSTLVQLRAPQAYRGRVLSFFLVALGVAYPVGSLVQGPVIDRIGLGWTTAGAAVLLALIMAAVALRRPGLARVLSRDLAPADSVGQLVQAERRSAGPWPAAGLARRRRGRPPVQRGRLPIGRGGWLARRAGLPIRWARTSPIWLAGRLAVRRPGASQRGPPAGAPRLHPGQPVHGRAEQHDAQDPAERGRADPDILEPGREDDERDDRPDVPVRGPGREERADQHRGHAADDDRRRHPELDGAEHQRAERRRRGERDGLGQVGANQLPGAEQRVQEQQQHDHQRSRAD